MNTNFGERKHGSMPGDEGKHRKKQLRISALGCADTGSREVQQDAYLASGAEHYAERGMLAVLSDGMGGMQNGDRFSNIAVEEMVCRFTEEEMLDDIGEELMRAYAYAKKAAIASCNGKEPDGGATVVAALVRKDMCSFLSVGDSRIYLFRGDGLILLNREHTLGVVLDEAAALGYIPEEEARENLRRAALTNHLCDTSKKQIDVCSEPFPLHSGDKIALMSDGVFGTIGEEEIARCLRLPGAQGADAMIDAVRLRKKERQDNYSVLVLSFETAQNLKAGRDHTHVNA